MDKLGKTSKEEAYYFPEGVDMGTHPETFFGVHPSIVERKQFDLLLPYLVEWKDDLILRFARAYLQCPDEGFHLPVRRPARAGNRAHHRAAGGLRRLRDAPGDEWRATSSPRTCCARTCIPMTASASASGPSSTRWTGC